MGGATSRSRWRRAAKRIGFPCASFHSTDTYHPPRIISSLGVSNAAERAEETGVLVADKSLCAICLEALVAGGDKGEGVFTAQCTHAFHFICIASNVRHGNVTCPICRAYWAELPHQLPRRHQTDPILRILDDSIANFRVNRRSSLHSIRYDDDDPVDTNAATSAHPRLHLTVSPITSLTNSLTNTSEDLQNSSPDRRSTSSLHELTAPSAVLVTQQTTSPNEQKSVSLSAKLSHQQATDIVLVVSPNGPHLRLIKQSLALVVLSLRPVDRVAIVTCSSAATSRAFALRRMSTEGKRIAFHVIDRLFYLGDTNPLEGLQKGIKILEDRMHRNPQSCILHISDSPTRTCNEEELELPIPIHRFYVGCGFGESNGLVMHEFEEFLARLVGSMVKETELQIGEKCLVRLGEMRAGEERRVPFNLMGDCGHICIGYSYIEGAGAEERLRTGEMVVNINEKGEGSEGRSESGCSESIVCGRSSSVERWDYLDPFMARRWAKHLHGYKA